MTIQINTDKHINGSQELSTYIENLVKTNLQRFDDKLTRVELHLSDENGGKSGADDKRCVLEGRLEGIPALAVTHDADTIHKAVDGATQKMKKAIEAKLGRLATH